MTAPRNTTNDSPMERLVTGMLGIEQQERQGQHELVESTVLPHSGQADADFEALGFAFGDEVDGDPLFREATLPDGWKREGSEHAMWSYIVDERGIRRVAVFYKAAFYDRDAFMRIENVGTSLASAHVYGGEADGLGGEVWEVPDVLTDDEREQARDYARRYLADAEQRPGIYGDRAHRARAVLDALG